MTKEEYQDLYFKYFYMPDHALEKAVGELHDRKFILHDISVYTEHRVAARVLIERRKGGNDHIFHLKNYVAKSC